MGTPVKVGDELVDTAREMAELSHRSIAKQIEHWAFLGRAVERLVKTSDVTAFKAHLSDPEDAEKRSEARAALQRLVQALVETTDREVARTLISETNQPVFEAASDKGRVTQVWPDGRRVVGRMVHGTFVAEEPSRKRSRTPR